MAPSRNFLGKRSHFGRFLVNLRLIGLKTIRGKDVGYFPLSKCLYPKYVPRVPGMCP